MRFKPPPPNSEIGWRVEFRPMEVESTVHRKLSFKNVFYTCFVFEGPANRL